MKDRANALLSYDEAKKKYAEKLAGDGVQIVNQYGTRSKHCMFRLINNIFSNEFAERFFRIGDTATRTELDGKLLNERSNFWLDVRATFIDTYPAGNERNLLVFDDDADFFGIDPSLAKNFHSAKKLQNVERSKQELLRGGQEIF
ncbi:unnamed protein product [Phytophthora fragariaefolia]|uniref:Unnamed protein product n=1 Tax=Phytophthora fragariaefolia TaxID=1490495 RepID=A0A9W6XXH5_9STRA|nr:unnamed protein product [Phytophthora fragariaefolia]